MIAACPFCGATMTETGTGAQHPYVSRSEGETCYMNGAHVGKELLPAWNSRAVLCDVEDGVPIFGYEKGTIRGFGLINQTIGYLASKGE